MVMGWHPPPPPPWQHSEMLFPKCRSPRRRPRPTAARAQGWGWRSHAKGRGVCPRHRCDGSTGYSERRMHRHLCTGLDAPLNVA